MAPHQFSFWTAPPGSVAVACHLFTFRHGQVVGLMMGALDEEADEAEAADSGDGLGIVCVL